MNIIALLSGSTLSKIPLTGQRGLQVSVSILAGELPTIISPSLPGDIHKLWALRALLSAWAPAAEQMVGAVPAGLVQSAPAWHKTPPGQALSVLQSSSR